MDYTIKNINIDISCIFYVVRSCLFLKSVGLLKISCVFGDSELKVPPERPPKTSLSMSWTYDALGRTTAETRPLGTMASQNDAVDTFAARRRRVSGSSEKPPRPGRDSLRCQRFEPHGAHDERMKPSLVEEISGHEGFAQNLGDDPSMAGPGPGRVPRLQRQRPTRGDGIGRVERGRQAAVAEQRLEPLQGEDAVVELGGLDEQTERHRALQHARSAQLQAKASGAIGDDDVLRASFLQDGDADR